ncbi:hypothetical protein ID866_12622 [Astraeus odoratus]|nr:hypothetical protein ID866_12622 [Astraeus odoratus]
MPNSRPGQMPHSTAPTSLLHLHLCWHLLREHIIQLHCRPQGLAPAPWTPLAHRPRHSKSHH